MTMTMTLLDHALSYRRRGWSIFPVCTPIPGKAGHCIQHGNHAEANRRRATNGRAPLGDPGKHPLVDWISYQRKHADEKLIEAWWTRWPEANIGIVTGEISNIVVLDTDGFEAYTAVLSHGGQPETPTSLTGKPSGYHFYFAHPGYRVRNFAGNHGVKGLDFRGDGGYVVAPPSTHARGVAYRWHEISAELNPAPTPPWLLELLSGATTTDPERRESAQGPHLNFEDILRGTPDGARDDTIWRLACRLRGDDIALDLARFIIVQAARVCAPPVADAVATEKVERAYREYRPNPRIGGFGTEQEQTPPEGDTDTDIPSTADWEWRVFNGAEFLALDIPKLAWIAETYLREQSVVFCYGPPGVLKTYLALDLALALATGGLFLRTFATVQGTVLFLQEDTTEGDFQQTYFGPMVEGLRIDPRLLEDSFFIAPPSGLTVDRAERVAVVESWIAEHRPAFIVADAFYLFHSSDGMTAKDISPIMRVFKHWRTKYGCSIFLIDHDRKGGGGRESDDGDPIDKLYGGRAKSAAADALWEMRRIKGADDQAFLHIHKLRGAKPPTPVRVRLTGGAMVIDGDRDETADGSIREIYEWLQRQGGSRTKQQISKALNVSEATVYRALGQLLHEGRVAKRGKLGHADLYGVAIPGSHWADEGNDDLPFK